MNGAEIEEKIEEVIRGVIDTNLITKKEVLAELTDLFITLSNERCKEQRVLCENRFRTSLKNVSYSILNAPLPLID